MKSLACLCLLTALSLPVQSMRAQEKTPDKTKAEHPKAIPVKVQVIFTELDGEKKVSSLPYSFTVVADDRPGGRSTLNLRTGVRVPVEFDGKDQKTTYIDVGANIDCGIRNEEDGKFRVFLNFDRSAIYPNKSADGERLVNEPNGQPLMKQFRISDELILGDGQTSEVVSTDPLSGHVAKVSVTINVQK